MKISRILLVVSLLILAGCNGAPNSPATDTTEPPPNATTSQLRTTSTPATTTDIDDELGFNTTAVARNVAADLGVEYVRPTVEIHTDQSKTTTLSPEQDRIGPIRGDTLRLLGFENRTIQLTRATAGTSNRHIRISPRNATTAELEHVFVHEYVHVLQFTTGELTPTLDSERAGSIDYTFTRIAIQEGVAVAIADRYAEKNELETKSEYEYWANVYRTGAPFVDLNTGHYYLGARHVRERAGPTESIRHVIQSPPRTSEEVIHGVTAPNTEIASLNLTVSVENSSWRETYRTQTGEFFTRSVLDTELPSTTAKEAAAGWGNDRFYRFESTSGRRAFVWVHRWDTTEDRAEFEAAAETYTAQRDNLEVEVRRIDERTTTIILSTDSSVVNDIDIIDKDN